MDAASTSQPPLGNTEPLSFLYLDAQGTTSHIYCQKIYMCNKFKYA